MLTSINQLLRLAKTIRRMRSFLILLTSIGLTNCAFGQTDSTYTPKATYVFNEAVRDTNSLLQSFYDTRGNTRWISKDHVTIVTTKLRLTSIEEEILELESQECKALLKRDTAALKDIWLRDFTLEEPQNELHLGKNPIPYYVGIHRTIEKFIILENTIYLSGYENTGRLKGDGKVEAPIIQKFTHVWTKKPFRWKLLTKTYEQVND